MKSIFLSVSIMMLCLTVYACRDINKAKSFEQMADRITTNYVGDSRVDRLEIHHRSTFKGLLVDGYTTIPEAYDSIQRVLSEGGFVVANNNFRLLPDVQLLEGRTTGIINVSVANLRSKPGHSQELATQALMGTPIQVLDFQKGWYLVRTPDQYLAWLEPGAFVAMKPAEARSWINGDLRLFVGNSTVMTTTATAEQAVSDLVPGDLLRFGEEEDADRVKVYLPDGTAGWVHKNDLMFPQAWFAGAPDIAASLLETANLFIGRPYLWGGTSPKGMDCSGFTKTAYYLNGYVIPRDASQQVHAGETVELTADFSTLEPGDLLFFGGYRDDGSEKITHVGFYTGNGRFLHAGADNGRIKEQSLRQKDEDFAEHRLKSLLRARRLGPGATGVVPVGEAFMKLLE